jgi:predicted small metal-binding protein
MKLLRCSDAGFACDHEIRAKSEADVLEQAAAHAQSVHHVDVTPDLAAQIRPLIRTDSSDAPANKDEVKQ